MKRLILTIVGVVGTIAFATLYFSNCSNLKGEIRELTAENAQWAADYDSCKNAKVYSDTSEVVTDHIIEVVEKPVPYEVVRYDTIIVKEVEYIYPVQTYSDTLITDDFKLFWRAEGIIDKIEFPYYRLYDKTVTESHVIEKIRYKDRDVVRSALYFSFGLNTKFENGLSGIHTGFDYINRKGWGIGVEYMRLDKTNYFGVDIKMRIL